ncbi:MAG: histidine kinase dimerization/phospho-acceptor domain-containing protein, partial [Pseudomonadota bacterium]
MRPTRPELGLRLRIAVVLATVCIVIIGTLGVTLDLASDDMEQSLVEQLVTEELESLVERTRAAQGYVAVSGPNLQYYVLTSKADYMQLPPEIRILGPGLHNIGRGSSGRRIAIRDGDRRRYIVVYDEGPHEVRKARFRQLLLFCVLSAAAVAILLGYKFAGVLTRQLDELSTRVAQLAPDEPHPPLARPDHDREVAALAHALDAYHARLMDVMQREQEFTTNTSHELRTPLTAIRTSCELLSADAKLDDKARRRVEFVANAAAQMTES